MFTAPSKSQASTETPVAKYEKRIAHTPVGSAVLAVRTAIKSAGEVEEKVLQKLEQSINGGIADSELKSWTINSLSELILKGDLVFRKRISAVVSSLHGKRSL